MSQTSPTPNTFYANKKIRTLLRYCKEYLSTVFILIITLILFSALMSSSFHQKLGNIFFGDVPLLYNVNLAQFFFFEAAHPLFGMAEPYANHQLSRTYFIKGDFDEALMLANKELELYPDHKRTYYIIGLTLGYMGREQEAIDAFSSFIEYNPNTWAARNDKAWLQFRIGDIDGALKTMDPVANNVNNPWIQNTYGTLLINKKKYTEAKLALTYAQTAANKMTEKTWGKAYPGNDPRIYGTGLSAMKIAIQNNLDLIDNAKK